VVAVYIANATKQRLQFAYRLPERKAAITQPIPIFGQERLSGDFSQPDIDSIMEQWGKYGLVKIEDLESARKRFDGYLISIGKPIPEEKLKRAIKYREAVLDGHGKILREQAAVAMINTIESESGAVARNYEISVVEEEPRGGYAPNLTHVAEGYRADRDSRPGSPPSRGRRRA
jgi:hypothetical protein